LGFRDFQLLRVWTEFTAPHKIIDRLYQNRVYLDRLYLDRVYRLPIIQLTKKSVQHGRTSLQWFQRFRNHD